MPVGYEVTNEKGERAWWDGKTIKPLNEDGIQVTGAGKQTEGERTAGFLSQRVADSVDNLVGINARNPRAARPGVIEAAANGIGWGGPANLARSGDRQQVVTNQMDLLDAALTLGTGAAYTKEQLDSYRDTYFPALTDKPGNVEAKQHKLLNLLRAAKIKAGSAAPPILDEALKKAELAYSGQGKTVANPFAITKENQNAIPEGSFFKGPDGKVYTQKKGAGWGQSQSPVASGNGWKVVKVHP